MKDREAASAKIGNINITGSALNWDAIESLFPGIPQKPDRDGIMLRLRKAFDSEMTQAGRELLILSEVQGQQTDGGSPVYDQDSDEEMQSSDAGFREPHRSVSEAGLHDESDEPAAVGIPAAPVVDGQVPNHMQAPHQGMPPHPRSINPTVVGSEVPSFSSPAHTKLNAANGNPVPPAKQARVLPSSRSDCDGDGDGRANPAAAAVREEDATMQATIVDLVKADFTFEQGLKFWETKQKAKFDQIESAARADASGTQGFSNMSVEQIGAICRTRYPQTNGIQHVQAQLMEGPAISDQRADRSVGVKRKVHPYFVEYVKKKKAFQDGLQEYLYTHCCAGHEVHQNHRLDHIVFHQRACFWCKGRSPDGAIWYP